MNPHMLLKLFFSLLVLITVGACSKKDAGIPTSPPSPQTPDPMAIFNFDNTDLRAPVKIKFENESQNADTYLWEFGDGTTSTEKNPEKVFATNGTFSVKLTASKSGKSDVLSKNVTIANGFNLMFIEKISVTGARLTGYDNILLEGSPEPDVYLKLSIDGASMSTNIVQNARSLNDLSWNGSFPIIVTRGLMLQIDVMDDDIVSSDDLMGSVQIRPEDYMTIDNRYPEVIVKTENGVTIELKVNWQFTPR